MNTSTTTTIPATWTKAQQKVAARVSHQHGYAQRGRQILVACSVCGTECEALGTTLAKLDAAVLYHFEVECGQAGV